MNYYFFRPLLSVTFFLWTFIAHKKWKKISPIVTMLSILNAANRQLTTNVAEFASKLCAGMDIDVKNYVSNLVVVVR